MKIQTINEIIKNTLNEDTTTGAGEAYMTPYAFSNGKPNKRLNKLLKKMGMEHAKNNQLVYKNLWHFTPPKTMNESLDSSDYKKIRNIIRSEIALVFYELFKKRAV